MLTDDDLPPELLALVVESLLYGIHLVLFPICVHVLFRRRRKMQMMMLAAVIVMFILATVDVAISWHILLRHTKWLYASDIGTLYKAVYPKFLLYLVNNVIADVLLILRCYVVWGNSKRILLATGLVLAVGTVFGIISEGTLSPSLKKFIIVYILSVLILNIGVTILTAGRILWIAREVRLVMGANMISRYHFAVGVIIESGVIYTASTILVIALSTTNLTLMAAVIAIRLVCIMPTLLIVLIALGQSTKDVNTTVSVLQAQTRQQIVLDTIVSSHFDFGPTVSTHDQSKREDAENARQLSDTDRSSLRGNQWPETYLTGP